MAQHADWIAADWGTSNLRLWALDAAGAVIAQRSSPKGMGGLAPEDFEPALLELAGDLLAPGRATRVVACGMAGARQGWIEAPYRAVPCTPAGPGAVHPPSRDPRLDVAILPGLSQANPPDVMRGEETQIAGFLEQTPGFDGTLCLPGTHSKWVTLAGGKVRGFRTAMTGEIFAFLAGQSVLRHAMAEGWDEAAFLAALDETLARPEALATSLFGIRAQALLAGGDGAAARSRLSGLLIWQELAATRPFWQHRPVTVIGAPKLSAAYVAALTHLGAKATPADGTGLVRAGLAAAHTQLKDQSA